MKQILHKLLLAFTIISCFSVTSLQAQTMSTLTVKVSALTGVSTQGLSVELNGEESGWVFDPVKVNAEGTARFYYVPEGVYTLSIDGSPLGLERYVDTNVEHSGDQTLEVELKEAVRTPYALTATMLHDDFTGENKAVISWNRETDYFFDDFESYEPFATNFEPWTGYDLDKEPAAEISGSYPNRGTQQYATIFNALTIDPPVYYEYEVLRPYSGKQFVGFVRTRSGNANNDWLISPKIKVGVNNIVSFMAKASEYQPDRFAVCISTSGTDIKDFVQLTPGNYQTVDYKEWKEISFNLAAYEGKEVYIAIHCMSQNSFMLMIDDFFVGPASLSKKARRVSRRSADNPNETFIVTLDGNQVGTTEDYEYTIDNLVSGNHIVGIKARYIKAESDESTLSIDVPEADAFAALSLLINDESKTPVDNATISLLNTASVRLTNVNSDQDGKALIGYLPKGKYMINVESELFDTYTSTIEFDGDKELAITLQQKVTDPYNITCSIEEQKDGLHSAELRWNQDLGYHEGFEEYPDFTQNFGDWTVIDNDKMPTYAFSIAGTLIEVPESRGEVGAMIFNPYSTKPVQASEDGLFLTMEGDKYVMFNSAEASKSDDWLISPDIKINKDYVLRFTAKSYTDIYPGLFEFCALKDKDTSKAEVLDSFNLESDWIRYELPLTAYEGETINVGFHHITYDGWLSFIDDIYVGPSDESTSSEGSHGDCSFDIYLNGILHDNTADTVYRFENLQKGEYVAGIQAIYSSGKKSNMTQYAFVVTDSGIMIINTDVDGEWKIYDLNGRELKEGETLPHGIYILRNGVNTLKVIM